MKEWDVLQASEGASCREAEWVFLGGNRKRMGA